MKEELIYKLFYTKFMLLITRSFKRQKYIDRLSDYIQKCFSEFDEELVDSLIEQVEFLSEKDCDRLFSEYFAFYRFIKFGKTRLEVDKYNPEDCRTFQQFNNAVKMSFLLIDYEENLEL